MAHVVTGNLAADATEVLVDGKIARVWTVIETGVLADDASEYVVYGVPKLGSLVLFECGLTTPGPGTTATTVDPRIGKAAAFDVDTADEIAVNVKPAVHIRNGRPCPYFASSEQIVVRTRPNGTADQIRTTIVILAALTSDGLKGDWQRGPNDRAGVTVRTAGALTQSYVASGPLDVYGFTWVDFMVRLAAQGDVTRVDARVSWTNDADSAAANWTVLQTESVTSGVATLDDYVAQKTVAGPANIPITVPVRGRFMRIEVLAGAGAAGQSSCSITALRRKD